MPTAPDSSIRPALWHKVLGVLIVVQFLAIFVANAVGYWKTVAPAAAARSPVRELGLVADRYCEVTGQPQGWGMFESGYMLNSVAWDVRIEWQDGRVERLQGVAQLPGDLAFWNPPAALNRRFVYESSLLGIDLILPEKEFERSDHFIEDVRINNATYLAFFRSIYDRERRRHADWPAEPKWMELVILRATTPDPRTGNGRYSDQRSVARWRPGKEADQLPVEAYDRSMPDEPFRSFPKP
jgi:hypothetical protein